MASNINSRDGIKRVNKEFQGESALKFKKKSVENFGVSSEIATFAHQKTFQMNINESYPIVQPHKIEGDPKVVNKNVGGKAIKVKYKTVNEIGKKGENLPKRHIFGPSPKPLFTFIDLFAGIGGFRLALQNIGGKCVYSSEISKFAVRTYEYNFKEIPKGDITLQVTKDEIPEQFDILCAGFPCQPFSIAGLRKGFYDTRGTLFFEIEEITRKHRPKVLFLENVRNLVTHDFGHTYEVIMAALKDLNYSVYYKVMNTMDYVNIPQHRQRVYIVAFNNELVTDCNHLKFPAKVPLTKTIRDFIEPVQMDEKYYYRGTTLMARQIMMAADKWDTMYQWRRKYVRENKSNVCPTLTANMGTGGHNVPIIRVDDGIRKLTPKECLNFMGFPKEFNFPPKMSHKQMYMQVGNSVTVPLIERIGACIVDVICSDMDDDVKAFITSKIGKIETKKYWEVAQ